MLYSLEKVDGMQELSSARMVSGLKVFYDAVLQHVISLS